jgi:hypothetical protein
VAVRIARLLRARLGLDRPGGGAADVSAATAVNVGERGAVTVASADDTKTVPAQPDPGDPRSSRGRTTDQEGR